VAAEKAEREPIYVRLVLWVGSVSAFQARGGRGHELPSHVWNQNTACTPEVPRDLLDDL
jgi:hypothetical protein